MDYLVILTHKTDILITLPIFLKKCEKGNGCLHQGTEGVIYKKVLSINIRHYKFLDIFITHFPIIPLIITIN